MAVLQVVTPAMGIAATLATGQQIHPPAIACSIAYMQAENLAQQWPTYLVAPVSIGVAYLLAVQLCVAKATRFVLHVRADSAAKAEGVMSDGGDQKVTIDDGASSSGGLVHKLNKSRRRAAFANARSRALDSGGDRLEHPGRRRVDIWLSHCLIGGSPTGSEFGDSTFASRVSSRAPSPPPVEKPKGASLLWQRAKRGPRHRQLTAQHGVGVCAPCQACYLNARGPLTSTSKERTVDSLTERTTIHTRTVYKHASTRGCTVWRSVCRETSVNLVNLF